MNQLNEEIWFNILWVRLSVQCMQHKKIRSFMPSFVRSFVFIYSFVRRCILSNNEFRLQQQIIAYNIHNNTVKLLASIWTGYCRNAFTLPDCRVPTAVQPCTGFVHTIGSKLRMPILIWYTAQTIFGQGLLKSTRWPKQQQGPGDEFIIVS